MPIRIPVPDQPLRPEQISPYYSALQSGLSTFNGLMNSYYLPKQLATDLQIRQAEANKRLMENSFLPQTLKSDLQLKQAEALSRMAYARLMGPQMALKAFQNEGIVANTPEPVRQQILRGALSTLAPMNQIGNQLPTQGIPSQALPYSSQQSIAGLQSLKDANTNENTSSSPIVNLMNSQEAKQQTNDEGLMNIPRQVVNDQIDYNSGNQRQQNIPQQTNNQESIDNNDMSQNTWPENVGRTKGIENELAESGTIRAKDMNTLSGATQTYLDNRNTLNELGNIISSDTIRNIRQIPLANQHEIDYYSKFGTKEQQQLIGRLKTLTGQVIVNSAQGLKGAFRVGEQNLFNSMKPNPADTIDVMIGKLQSLMYLNEMVGQRSKITNQLMNQYHINKGQALDLADKQINGEAIRQNIYNQLNPDPTDEDINYMAQKYNIKPDEVKRRLKSKGYFKNQGSS